MKIMGVVIVILLAIFLGIFYTRTVEGAETYQVVTVEEVSEIEKYIGSIYMWESVTKEAIPSFESIEKADYLWIYEVIKQNLNEQYVLSEEMMRDNAKKIFGQDFELDIENNILTSFWYEEESKLYYPLETILSTTEDRFILKKIEKQNNIYTIEMIEYQEEYRIGVEEEVIVKTINDEEIYRTTLDNHFEVIDIVKENEQKFDIRQIQLKEVDGEIYIINSEKLQSE